MVAQDYGLGIVMSSLYDRVSHFFDSMDSLDEVLINAETCVGIGHQQQLFNEPHWCRRDDALDLCFEMAERCQVRLDALHPSSGGVLDRIRWHAMIAPLVSAPPLLSFRRSRFGLLALQDFQGYEKLATSIAKSRHLVIAGPTGAGKTSLLFCMAQVQWASKRAVVIEHFEEWTNASSHWIAMKTSSPIGAQSWDVCRLFEESLRLRPDGYLLAEVRSPAEARAFLQASQSGHEFVWTTLHADTVEGALKRLHQLGISTKTNIICLNRKRAVIDALVH
jgi:Flp pilus assembly CpaF family ATPase